MNDPTDTSPSIGLEPPPALKKRGVLAWLRARFFAGMVIVLPIAATFMILRFLITEIDKRVVPLLPAALRPQEYLHFAVPGFGLFILIVFLTLLGAVTTNLAGKAIVNSGQWILARVPVVNSVYSLLKQITDIFASNGSNQFKEVVLVEYPRAGAWSLAFITGNARGVLLGALDSDHVGVFVATTPNPTTGFLIYVPRKDVRRLDISVEEGAKIIFSAGLVVPERLPLKAGEPPISMAS